MNCGRAVFSDPYFYREGWKLPFAEFNARAIACGRMESMKIHPPFDFIIHRRATMRHQI
jgi:hypothetical protein